jgi:hypothetical protein
VGFQVILESAEAYNSKRTSRRSHPSLLSSTHTQWCWCLEVIEADASIMRCIGNFLQRPVRRVVAHSQKCGWIRTTENLRCVNAESRDNDFL